MAKKKRQQEEVKALLTLKLPSPKSGNEGGGTLTKVKKLSKKEKKALRRLKRRQKKQPEITRVIRKQT